MLRWTWAIVTLVVLLWTTRHHPRLAGRPAVALDATSIIVEGKATFIYSAEFHPWRLPSTALYRDILEKIKAGGFNAISVYTHWGVIQREKGGPLRLDGWKGLEETLELAKELELYVVVRPGPYINAETTAGGFPGWTIALDAVLRTDDQAWTEAWTGYMTAMAKLTAKYQVGRAGTVIALQIDNELDRPTSAQKAYMAKLIATVKAAGVTVPISYNEPDTENNDFLQGKGAVDLWGLDRYPLGLECTKSRPRDRPQVESTLRERFQDALKHKTSNPFYIPEFQAGSMDSWGGPGYELCRRMTDASFQSVAYRNLIAAGATMINFYMGYGGTNWGHLAEPTVYTSYDYAALIREDRSLDLDTVDGGDGKYADGKALALFVAASPGLASTKLLRKGEMSGVYVTVLESLLDQSRYYIIRHIDSNSEKDETYDLVMDGEDLTGLVLPGLTSRILVSNYPIGHTYIRYTSAEVITWARLNQTTTILYIRIVDGRFGIAFDDPGLVVQGLGEAVQMSNGVLDTDLSDKTLETLVLTSDQGSVILAFGDQVDTRRLWQPRPELLVLGPQLLRSARVTEKRLELTGDLELEKTTAIRLYIHADTFEPDKVTWNDRPIVLREIAPHTYETSVMPVLGHSDINLPTLSKSTWRVAPSLPETKVDFDDTAWVKANRMELNKGNMFKPGTTPILYADLYGYHMGNILWRGHFTTEAKEAEIHLEVYAGLASAFSIWINDKFVGSWECPLLVPSVNVTIPFQSFQVSEQSESEDNVITILQDHTGLDENDGRFGSYESEGYREPRGIRSYSITKGRFTSWRVQGNYGADASEASHLDHVRGPLNEGGLYGERLGWHLPGFQFGQISQVSNWPLKPLEHSAVVFFQTDFELHLPKDLDVSLGVRINPTSQSWRWRAQLYVNGWQFGKANNRGPQTLFYVPSGIIDHNGHNRLMISLWNLDHEIEHDGSLEVGLEVMSAVEGVYELIAPVKAPRWRERDSMREL